MSERMFLRKGPLSWAGEKIAGNKGLFIGKVIEPAPMSYPYRHLWRTISDESIPSSDREIDPVVAGFLGHVLEIAGYSATIVGPKWLAIVGYGVGRILNLGSELQLVDLQQLPNQSQEKPA